MPRHQKYGEDIDEVLIRIPHSVKLMAQEAAKSMGKSFNAFCVDALAETSGMKREAIVEVVGYRWIRTLIEEESASS